jgi:ribosomal protein S18 acetylase RimI-like enzyme
MARQSVTDQYCRSACSTSRHPTVDLRGCKTCSVKDPQIKVRSARLDDLYSVVELWEASGGPTRHAGRHADALRLIERDSEALLVAIEDQRVVGTLIVGWDGWRCHLYRLVVHPQARRNGIARRLAEAAMSRAQSLGAARLDAMVDPDNTSAVEFWEQVGYERDHDRRWSRPVRDKT